MDFSDYMKGVPSGTTIENPPGYAVGTRATRMDSGISVDVSAADLLTNYGSVWQSCKGRMAAAMLGKPYVFGQSDTEQYKAMLPELMEQLAADFAKLHEDSPKGVNEVLTARMGVLKGFALQVRAGAVRTVGQALRAANGAGVATPQNPV